MAKKAAGFGNPGEHDFYVVIPGKNDNDTVQIIERYFWPSDDDRRLDILRLELPRERWDLVSKGISDEFNRRLKAEKLQARLILQVHDELIVECPEAEAEHVRKLLEEEMENAVQLSVPLIAEAHIGHSWAEAH